MVTDFSRSRYKLLDRMRASRLPASKLPRSTKRDSSSGSVISSRDKPLPCTPIATIVPLSPGSVNTFLNDESRPHSPSAASFSRVRRASGLPTRSGAASPLSRTTAMPYRRNSSRLSNTPSTPDSYNVTHEELFGLRNANRLSREGRSKRIVGLYPAKLVDIPPRNKVNQQQFSSSPPCASMHTSPLPTIHSQSVLPAFDFEDLQPLLPRPEANSITSATPPSTPQLSLPPRSDSRTPVIGFYQDHISRDIDDSSLYGGFSTDVDEADFDDEATEADSRSEAGDGSPIGKGIVRNDSPMESIMRPPEGVVSGMGNIGGEELKTFPKQKLAEVAVSASQFEQELADRIEPFPELHRPTAPSQTPMHPPRLPGYGSLAGIDTPGKMRAAAREPLQQQGEPSFARRTASSTAKSSAPPDIPRVTIREPQKLAQLPPKPRGVLGRLGGLFHKGQKKEKDDNSPIRMRIGRNPANNKLNSKRQSVAKAVEINLGPTSAPPSPQKISPPALASRRSVSPASDAMAIPAAASISGEEVAVSAPVFDVSDATKDATTSVCARLEDKARIEPDERRRDKLLAIALSLSTGLINALQAGVCATRANIAADEAKNCLVLNEEMLKLMRKRADFMMKKK